MPAFYYSIGARYYKCERFTITMEVSCMKTQRRTADEQYQLIMECRNSGLSDYQWCTEHNINPGTFYNWVKRLRKKLVMISPLPQDAAIISQPLNRML